MRQKPTLFAAGIVLAAAGAARADETTFCNAYITTLPYTISVQGHYCFNRNLSTAITTGAAITINTDFVVLDLNNFKLGGGSAGVGTQARGVTALNRKNITVRNGNIRGFNTGIELLEDAVLGQSANHTIENNLVDGNTVLGVRVEGSSNVLRRNTITNIGGAVPYALYTGGAALVDTDGYGFQVVEDNFVGNVYGLDLAYGLYGSDFSVAQRNTVSFSEYGDTFGLFAGICRDNNVAFAAYPLACASYNDNLLLGY